MTTLGPDSAAPGARIVWEAKEDKSYDLEEALSPKSNRPERIGRRRSVSSSSPATTAPRRSSAVRSVRQRCRNRLGRRTNPDSDLNIRIAYSVARALAIRENHESVESEQALKAIDLATRAIEKQLEHLDQIKTWAETVKNNGEKMADRAGRMRADLAREVEALGPSSERS